MNSITKVESSELLREWERLCRDSSLPAKSMFEAIDTRCRIRVDYQTTEWILDLEFPVGGSKPKIIDTLKFIRVEECFTESVPKRRLLTIRYNPTGNDCREFWPHFAEAIVTAAAKAHPKTQCAQSVARTFESWRKFWPGKRQLGPEQIMGLFAELVFLGVLLKVLSPAAAIEAWHGPKARDHDFGIQQIALEVKSSAGRSNKVTIANLDQLNDAGLSALYLVSVQLRSSDDERLSLQARGDSIQRELNSEELKIRLNSKLGLAGWFKATETQRREFRYRLVGRKLYPVKEGFPRILKKDLPQFGPGVDVRKYSINLDKCPQPALAASEEEEVWKQLQQTA